MTLLDLLMPMTVVASISAAMASASDAHAGFWGYAIALFLSLILGVACAWALRASAKRVAMKLKDHPKTLGERLSVISYFCAAVLWPHFAALLGGWTSYEVLQLR